MARINVNPLSIVRIVRIEGCFHRLLLYFTPRERFENRGSSALSALSFFMPKHWQDLIRNFDIKGVKHD